MAKVPLTIVTCPFIGWLTAQVTNLGWNVDNVTANANICMQTVAPCDTPDALCQGASCRYSIFNEAVRGVAAAALF